MGQNIPMFGVKHPGVLEKDIQMFCILSPIP